MKTELRVINEKTWIYDEHNNRASVDRWGNEELAIAALNSCSDCSRCSDCYGCYGCSDCSGCSGCSDCSGCSGCYGCSDCSGCSDCYGKTNRDIPEIPVIEDIHQKVYEAARQPGALNMGDWHSCETTHCRAGWVIHLAGDAGYALEKATSSLFAAMQIYKASDPSNPISPCRFFDSNEKAMMDMERLAGVREFPGERE